MPAPGYYFTGVMAGCGLAGIPFIFGMYRLDLTTRSEGLTHQLVRLLERRFNHHRVGALTKQVDEEVDQARSVRPALFRFEVPLDQETMTHRNRTIWDEHNPATWGVDARINLEYYSKSMSDPESKSVSIDKVLNNVAATRTYMKAVVEGKL